MMSTVLEHAILGARRALAFVTLAVLAALLLAPAPARAAACTVISLADSGPGTLREKIDDASCDTINFNLALPAVINLTSGHLAIWRDLTIVGPGASLLTVQRALNGCCRIFEIESATGATVVISGLTIANGRAVEQFRADGGGILNLGATLIVTNSTLSGNIAANFGGGIHNEAGTVTVTHSTLSGNRLQSDPSFGGGIANIGGTLTVENSTFSGNSANILGGGIYNEAGTVTVTHSTLAGNVVRGEHLERFGGGVVVGGGAISNENGNDLTLNNTIVAHNTGGASCLGNITDGGWNLSYPDTSCPGETRDPLLDPLADNGGPTRTHALQPGSPAIDAIPFGANRCGTDVTTDQRGVSRPQPQNGLCDIGAYELVFAFTGFFQPVENTVLNVVKAGQAIPVKFGLGGNHGLNIFAGGYPASRPVACPSADNPSEITETVTASKSGLSYDAGTDTYTYVWKTDKGWANTCRRLTVKFSDGTTKTADFHFSR